MRGTITKVESKPYNFTNDQGQVIKGENLILHVVYADGSVQQVKTKREVFQKLNGNIPDSEVMKHKYDITVYYQQNTKGQNIANLQFLEQ